MKNNSQSGNNTKLQENEKWKYIIKNVIFIRVMPILVFIIMINEAYNGTYAKNPNLFYVLIAFKVCLAILVGIFCGLNEWKFNQRLVGGYFKNINEIRNEYIKIFGVLCWGMLGVVGYFKIPITVTTVIFNLVIWLSFGFLLGLFNWRSMKIKYEKYVRS